MSYLVDTNVLLRLAQPNHPMRNDARQALIALRKRNEALCVVPQTIVEFWAVATRPVENNGLGLTTEETVRETSKLKRLFKLRADTPVVFAGWEKLVMQYRVAGKQTHDARLVAAMLAHGLTHILTFNTGDFKRFSEISAVDPASVK